MRLINADALKRQAQKVATEAWKMKIYAQVETTMNEFIDWIDAQPTIEERKTGHWTAYTGVFNYDCKCSECGSSSWEDSDYCPWCGAKMEVEHD